MSIGKSKILCIIYVFRELLYVFSSFKGNVSGEENQRVASVAMVYIAEALMPLL